MKTLYRTTILVLLTMLTVGCGPELAALDLDTAINQEFGGLSADDDAPMFAEEETFSDLEQAEADPAAEYDNDSAEDEAGSTADEAVSEIVDDEGSETQRPLVFALRAVWGRQVLDPTDSTVTHWNPTFTTDCGVLAIKRLVRFDGADSVVRPRTNAQSVSFISRTAPAFDGVVLALAIPQAGRECAQTGVLTIESDAFAEPVELPLNQTLLDNTLRVEVDTHRNFLMQAHQIEPQGNQGCVKGMLGGRWVAKVSAEETDTSKGRFYGRYLNAFGELKGHIRGIWGTPSEGRFAGRQVFYGKIINTEGNFVGLLAGRYGDGTFGGGWYLRPSFQGVHGRVKGIYGKASAENINGGRFGGRYVSSGCEMVVPADILVEADTE